MPTTVLFDNFDNDNLTGGNLPSTNWDHFDTGFSTATGTALSGTRALKYSNPGSSGFGQSANNDRNGGNSQIKASVYFSGLVQECTFGLLLRSDAGILNYYQLNIEPTGATAAGAMLFKTVNGVQTQLGSTLGRTAFTTGQWYTVQLVANGATLKVFIQRVQDKAWLNSFGQWAQVIGGASPLPSLTVTDASLSSAGFGQVAAYQSASETSPLYIDDVIFENLLTTEPLWQRVPRHRGGRPALRPKIRVKRRVNKELLHHVQRKFIATPTYINSATANNSGNGNSLTIAIPDGITMGDVLMASITCDNNQGSTLSAPAAWTLIRSDTQQGSNLTLASYYRVVDGTEPANYQWTTAFTCRLAGIISDYSGVDLTNPIEASTVNYSLTTNNVVSTNDYSLLYCVYADQQGGDSPWTADPSETDRAEDETGNRLNPNVSLMQSDETLGPAGNTGTRTATPNGGSGGLSTIAQAIVLGAPAQIEDTSWYRRFSRPRQHKPAAALRRRKRRGLATIAAPPAPMSVPNAKRPKRRYQPKRLRVKRRAPLPSLLPVAAGFDVELYHPARKRRPRAGRPRVKRHWPLELLPAPAPAFASPTFRRARRKILRAKIFRKKKFPGQLLPQGPPGGIDLPNVRKPKRRFQRRPMKVKRRRPDALLPWILQQYFYECFGRPQRKRRPPRRVPHVKRRVPVEVLPYTEPDFLHSRRDRRFLKGFAHVKRRFPVEVLPQPFDPLAHGALDRKRRPKRLRPRGKRHLPLDALFPPMMADFLFWPHRGRRRPARTRLQRHRRGITSLIPIPAVALDADLFRRRQRAACRRVRPRHRPWPQLIPTPAGVVIPFDVSLFRRAVKRKPVRFRRKPKLRPLYLYPQVGLLDADLFRRRRRAARARVRRHVRPWVPLFPAPTFDPDLFGRTTRRPRSSAIRWRRQHPPRRNRVLPVVITAIGVVLPIRLGGSFMGNRNRNRSTRAARARRTFLVFPPAASFFWPEGLYRRFRRRPAAKRPHVKRRAWNQLLPRQPLGFNDQPFRRVARRIIRPGKVRRRPRAGWFASVMPARFDPTLYRRPRQSRRRLLRHRLWRTGWQALPAAPVIPPAIIVIPIAPAVEEWRDLLRPREFADSYRSREFLEQLRLTEWIMGVQQTREKWAAEVRDFWFNFSPQQEIVNGDTLSSPLSLTYDPGIQVYTDATLGTLIPSGGAPPASTMNAATSKLTFWVKGGTGGGTLYNLDCQVKTTGGRILEAKGILKVN